jgi:hypothetical protein
MRSFVSQVPQSLLQDFFRSLDIPISPEFLRGTPAAVADAVKKVLRTSPRGTVAKVMHQIETVEKLASEAGETAIDSVVIHDELSGLPSRHARALWLFLNDQEGFRRAEDIVYSDGNRYGRLWSAYTGPQNADLRRDADAQSAFKAALRQTFDTPNVHIEIFDRTRPEFPETDGSDEQANLVQITLFREDRPNAEHAFVGGELTIQTRRAVIEAALTYEPSSGIIECIASHRATRDEVVAHFATFMLGCLSGFEPCAARSYDLTALSQPLEFATDPVDRIEDVKVSLLRLQPVETAAERLTIERLPGSEKDIWTVVTERLGKDALTSDYNISQARILIRYRPSDSNRLRSLPILITHPHKSNIREQSEIERAVSSKYLARWGLLAAQ